VLATNGTPLTRSFPKKEIGGEDHDHPHHRSLWFAYSDVNGGPAKWVRPMHDAHVMVAPPSCDMDRPDHPMSTFVRRQATHVAMSSNRVHAGHPVGYFTCA
jgi:hypothetical protein